MSKRTNEPSLSALSFILRHEELWPEGFKWNWYTCDTCAMGMAHRIWPETVIEPTRQYMTRIFNIPDKDATLMFCTKYGARTPTPKMIADQIDQYLTV